MKGHSYINQFCSGALNILLALMVQGFANILFMKGVVLELAVNQMSQSQLLITIN
jgi:hypothetical protein